MSKIFELFGYPLADASEEATRTRKRAWCPFMDTRCDGGGNRQMSVVDLSTKQTTTLVIRDLEPPSPVGPDARENSSDAGPNASELSAAAQRLAVGDDDALVFDVALPAGYHLNPAAPNRYKVTAESGGDYLALGGLGSTDGGHTTAVSSVSKDVRLPLRLKLKGLKPGAASLRAELTLYYCREDNTGTCRIKTLTWRVPVEVTDAADAPHELKLQGKVE